MALTYLQSGVNYSLMDAFKNACLKASGNNPQWIELPDSYLVDILEGLGSLNQLADDIYNLNGKSFYYQVGWGNAATILNDISAMGASPLTLKMFVGVGNEKWFLKQVLWKDLIKGFNSAANFCQTFWNGGETQTLVNVIKTDSFVIAGSTTGLIKPKSNLFTDEKLKKGDRIILLESSGIHTNGITLIRKIFKKDLPILESAIRNKTIIYTPFINELLKQKIDIHYASHITGHGWRKIMRSKKNFTYQIDKIPKPQPVFSAIQQKTKMTIKQMYGDYNMGVGFALFVPQKAVTQVLKIAQKFNLKALDAGFIQQGDRKVVIKPLEITYQGLELIIR